MKTTSDIIPRFLDAVDKKKNDLSTLSPRDKNVVFELREIIGEIYMRPFTPLEQRTSYETYMNKLIELLNLNPVELQHAWSQSSNRFQSRSKGAEGLIVDICVDHLKNIL